jgi:DNA-binding protein H-NS
MFEQKYNLDKMSLDELWSLHEELCAILTSRILDQKRQLEERFSLLNHRTTSIEPLADRKARRRYPKVSPQYRNPETSETWAGRGRQPRWLTAAMKAGRRIEEFRINR